MRLPTYSWRGPVPNEDGAMGNARLFVVHIMSGTLAGTDSWFHNPAAQVSAHLGHGKAGERYQWVDTDVVAWAEAAYNDVAWSAEHEGVSGDTLTAAQCESLAFAIAQWSQATGYPMTRAIGPNGVGVIGHSELGGPGGNHPYCPGQPILDQLPAIIVRARQIRRRTMAFIGTAEGVPGEFVVADDLSRKHPLVDQQSAQALVDAGYQTIPLSAAELNSIPSA